MNTLLKIPLTTVMLVTCCFASQEFPFDNGIPTDQDRHLTVEHTDHNFTGVINFRDDTSTFQIDKDCNWKVLGTAIILGTPDDKGKIILDGTITLYKDDEAPQALQDAVPEDTVPDEDDEAPQALQDAVPEVPVPDEDGGIWNFSLKSVRTCSDTRRAVFDPDLEELRPQDESAKNDTADAALLSGYQYDNSNFSIKDPEMDMYYAENAYCDGNRIPPLDLAALTSNAPLPNQNEQYVNEEYGQYEDQTGYYNNGMNYDLGFAEAEPMNNVVGNNYQGFFMNYDPYYNPTVDFILPVQVLPVKILQPTILPVKVLSPAYS